MADAPRWNEIVNAVEKPDPVLAVSGSIIQRIKNRLSPGVDYSVYVHQGDQLDTLDEASKLRLTHTISFAKCVAEGEWLTWNRATMLGLDMADKTVTGPHSRFKQQARIDGAMEDLCRDRKNSLLNVREALPEYLSQPYFTPTDFSIFRGLAELYGIAKTGRTPDFLFGYVNGVHDVRNLSEGAAAVFANSSRLLQILRSPDRTVKMHLSMLKVNVDQALAIAANPNEQTFGQVICSFVNPEAS